MTLGKRMLPTIGKARPVWNLIAQDDDEETTTSTSNVDLKTISGLSIPVTSAIEIIALIRKTAGAASGIIPRLKLNSTVVVADVAWAATADEVGSGEIHIWIPPRQANYLRAGVMRGRGVTGTGTGFVANTNFVTADLPNVTITSIAIGGKVVDAAVTLAVSHMKVFEIPF